MVLVFWAVWDEKSRDAMHVVEDVLVWSLEDGAAVVVLPVNETTRGRGWEAALDYWERHPFAFSSLIDPDQVVMRAYGILGVPMAIVVDAKGRVQEALAGPQEITLERVKTAVSAARKRPPAGGTP